jgi:hypothetical protein
MNQSISSILGNAKMRLTSTLNAIIDEGKLPTQLYESVLLEMLLEIRQQKLSELVSENVQLYNRISELEKGESNEKQD